MNPRLLEFAERLWGWSPHSDGQREYLLCTAKNKIAACGRRWGKSESTAIDIATYALAQPHSIQFVIAPTDDQSKIIMEEVSRRLFAVPGLLHEIREIKSPYHSVTLLDAAGLKQGTKIAGRTAGVSGKGLRGHKAHRVIVDEAGFVDDAILDKAVSPMLADYDGDLVKISTPNGRNHFYRDFVLGQNPNENPRYKSFRFRSDDNPFLSADFLAEEKRTKPEQVWLQEYCAEFMEDEGAVFRNVVQSIVPDLLARIKAKPSTQPCSFGLDLARYQDFSVLSGLDAVGRQCFFERLPHVSWERQIERVCAVMALYPKARLTIDSTGVGDPIFELLRKRLTNNKIVGYTLTQQSKEDLIDNLAIMLENSRLHLLPESVQKEELLAFRYEITPSGHRKMGAPSSMHDDTVIALALAAWKLDKVNSVFQARSYEA